MDDGALGIQAPKSCCGDNPDSRVGGGEASSPSFLILPPSPQISKFRNEETGKSQRSPVSPCHPFVILYPLFHE